MILRDQQLGKQTMRFSVCHLSFQPVGCLRASKNRLFTLRFITELRLQLWSNSENNVMLGGTVLKGCSIREVENHCSIRTYSFPPFWRSWCFQQLSEISLSQTKKTVMKKTLGNPKALPWGSVLKILGLSYQAVQMTGTWIQTHRSWWEASYMVCKKTYCNR